MLGISYISMTTRQLHKVNVTLKIIILICVALSSLSLIKGEKNLQLTMKYFPPSCSRHPPNPVHNLIMEPTRWTLERKKDVSAVVRNETGPTVYSHHSSSVRLN